MVQSREALYGGAAGGGKSEALLAAALQYADVPGYAALLLRRTYPDLTLPGAIMDRAQTWLYGTGAHWDAGKKTFIFPSGASLTFGFLQYERDKYRYQSAEFQFVGFDELTQFPEASYTYLFSRLRRKAGVDVPVRMRAATNPGGVGHVWVKDRFQLPAGRWDRPFISARLVDNPHVDRAEYTLSLMDLSPVVREQLLNGDWNVAEGGFMFERAWFEIIEPERLPGGLRLSLRFWDLAATEEKRPNLPDSVPGNVNPAYTAGAKVGFKDGVWYIIDMRRFRANPKGVEDRIKACASQDGRLFKQVFEREGGSGGKNTIDHYRRYVLPGYSVHEHAPQGSKPARAGPVSSAAQAGNVKLVRGAWNEAFMDEAELFPYGPYKDQIDAVSGAFQFVKAPAGGFLDPNARGG